MALLSIAGVGGILWSPFCRVQMYLCAWVRILWPYHARLVLAAVGDGGDELVAWHDADEALRCVGVRGGRDPLGQNQGWVLPGGHGHGHGD